MTTTSRMTAFGVAIFLLAAGGSATGQEIRTWSGGGGNSDWFNGDNWSGAGNPPAAGEKVVIGVGIPWCCPPQRRN